ncbi:hypothetical protein [Polystyrenella longa]|nr:hypothetical protein [Polystyrenella longa]
MTQVGVQELTELKTPTLLADMPIEWQYKLGFDRMVGIEVAKNSQIEEAIELFEPKKITAMETYPGSRQITDDGLKMLSKFPNLKKLHLRNTSITDDGLRHLVQLQNLEEIIFENNTLMTGMGLKILKDIPGLLKIEVSSGIDHDILWEAMCDVPQVKEVVFQYSTSPLGRDNKLTTKLLKQLHQPVAWNRFLYLDPKVEPEALEHMRFLSSVGRLHINGWTLDRFVMQQLGELPGLSNLDFEDCKFNDEAASLFQKMGQLSHLTLRNCEFSSELPKAVGELPNLSSFNCFGSPLDDEGLQYLCDASHLTDLGLNNTKITDAGLVHLGKLEWLTRLSLANNGLTDEGVTAIPPMSKLNSIGLSRNQIKNRGVKHLAKFRGLSQIDLSHNPVESQSVQALADLPALLNLSLADIVIDWETYRLLKKRKLSGFEFKVSDVTKDYLVELESHLSKDSEGAESEEQNKSEAVLGVVVFGNNINWSIDFSGSNITDEALPHILQNSAMTTLNLSDTEISDAGFISAFEELTSKGRPRLSINLSGTQVTDKLLAEMVSHEQHVYFSVLNLSRTAISDEGIMLLTQFPNLYVLDVSQTNITDACLPALKKMPRVSRLVIKETGLSAESIQELKTTFPRKNIVDELPTSKLTSPMRSSY